MGHSNTARKAPDASTAYETCLATSTACVDAFAGVTDTLGALRDKLMRLCDDLTAFSKLAARDGAEAEGGEAGAQPKDTLGQLADALAALRAALGTTRSRAQDPTRARAFAEPIDMMGTVGRMSVKLRSVSILIRSSSQASDLRALTAFLEALTALTDDMGDTAKTVAREVDTMRSADARFQETATRVDADLAPAETALRDRLGKTRALDRAAQVTGSKLRTEANRLGDTIRQELLGFVSTIQFSDRLAQRIEHIGAILRHDDPRLFQLAGQQTHALGEDLAQQAASLARSLQALSDAGSEGAALFSDTAIVASISDAIGMRETMAADLADTLDRVEALTGEMHADAEATGQAVDGAIDQVARLNSVSRDLDQAAINSSLVAARAGDAAGPLRFLSGEVRETASQCFDVLAAVEKAIGGLGTELSAEIANAQGSGEALTRAARAFREEIAASQAQLAALRGLQVRAASGAQDTVALIAQAQDRARHLQTLADHLTDLARAVAAAHDPAAPNPADLAAIRDSYTMPEERALHDALFPEQAPAAVADKDAASGDDDLDDIFF